MLSPIKDATESTAPEILLEQREYDFGMDIWSLGCLICELIHASEPYIRHMENKDPSDKRVLMKEHMLKGTLFKLPAAFNFQSVSSKGQG